MIFYRRVLPLLTTLFLSFSLLFHPFFLTAGHSIALPTFWTSSLIRSLWKYHSLDLSNSFNLPGLPELHRRQCQPKKNDRRGHQCEFTTIGNLFFDFIVLSHSFPRPCPLSSAPVFLERGGGMALVRPPFISLPLHLVEKLSEAAPLYVWPTFSVFSFIPAP